MSISVCLVVDDSLPDNITCKFHKDPYLYEGKDAAIKCMYKLLSPTDLIGDLLKLYIPMLPIHMMKNKMATQSVSCNT